MSDLKVLGARVDEKLYNEFKQLPGDISSNLRHAVKDYIKYAKEPRLTTVNEKEKLDEYETLACDLNTLKDGISSFYDTFDKYGPRPLSAPPLFQMVIDLTNFHLTFIELLESLIKIQLNISDTDQRKTPENKDNDIWEEG